VLSLILVRILGVGGWLVVLKCSYVRSRMKRVSGCCGPRADRPGAAAAGDGSARLGPGQPVPAIAELRTSQSYVREVIAVFNAEGSAALDPNLERRPHGEA
jgi:hypothetical protein